MSYSPFLKSQYRLLYLPVSVTSVLSAALLSITRHPPSQPPACLQLLWKSILVSTFAFQYCRASDAPIIPFGFEKYLQHMHNILHLLIFYKRELNV